MKSSSIAYHSFKKNAYLKDSVRLVAYQDYLEMHRKNPIHRHAFFELQFVWKGSGEQRIDFQKLPVKENSFLLIQPNQVHQADKAYFEEIDIIVFNSEYIGFFDYIEILQPGLQRRTKQFQLSDVDVTTLKKYIELFRTEHDKAANRVVLQGILMAILGYLDRSFIESSGISIIRDERITSFLNALEKEFIHHHQAAYYASELNLTVKHLNRIVAKELGKSVAAIIRDRITLEIKRLLSYSNKTHKEIAYELGFTDPHYMSHFFKSQTGIRPSQFKG